jgi:hypothetical protein
VPQVPGGRAGGFPGGEEEEAVLTARNYDGTCSERISPVQSEMKADYFCTISEHFTIFCFRHMRVGKKCKSLHPKEFEKHRRI